LSENHNNEDYVSYAKDIGFVTGIQIILGLLQFIRLPILTKWLGASLFGDWSIIWVTISLIAPFISLGLGITLVRFLASEKDISRIRDGFISVLVTVLAMGTVVSLILILCSDLFAASILGDISNSTVVKLAAFTTLTQALSGIGVNFFRTFRRMKMFGILNLIKAGLELGLMALFLNMGWELKGLVYAILAGGILSSTISITVILKKIGIQIPRFKEMKSFLKYSLPLMPTNALMWIIHSSDRYIIGYFMESPDVGIYAAANRLTFAMSLIVSPLQMVLLPTVSKSFDDGDIKKTKTYLKYSLKYLLLISIPAAFGISILASPLLRILTTREFMEGSVVVPFVAAGLFFFCYYRVCTSIILLVKKTIWVSRILVIVAAANVILNLVLVPQIGIIGAAVATLVAYFIMGVASIIISSRYLKFDLGWSFLIKSVIASSVMAATIWFIQPIRTIEVLLCIFFGIVIYFGILLLLKGISKAEFNIIKELILSVVPSRSKKINDSE